MNRAITRCHGGWRYPDDYCEKNRKKFWKEETPNIVSECLSLIESVKTFSSSALEEIIKKYIENNELGFGKVMNPLRLAIVGASQGPHLFDIMEMIGKAETTKRIKKAISQL